MKKPLTGALCALTLAGATALVTAAPASAATVNFAGTVALSNCSGSLVRMPTSVDSDPGLILTNGHCLESGMPAAGQVITNQASTRSFTLLSSTGGSLGTVRANRVLYSTMTDTDVTLYRLSTSYATIKSRYGISPLTMSTTHPVAGSSIKVVSGYWKKIYSCSVDGFAYRLKEGGWTFKDSLRYTSGCDVIGGTSGSPVVDATSGQVVAVNNTINEDGQSCTLDNPCEVDQNGTVTIHPGIGYAQETYTIPNCFAPGNVLDLTRTGCVLPRP
ncbi:trypsin-like peptidase domain-containing protein [Kitasatospora sp. NPDC001540]|uniref:S1 family peptidase n=1 Tax=Kitasatospora sp. NPDC001540 TaxID=3364014 RepID=UPI0036B1243F